jgi:hypothetical protein
MANATAIAERQAESQGDTLRVCLRHTRSVSVRRSRAEGIGLTRRALVSRPRRLAVGQEAEGKFF